MNAVMENLNRKALEVAEKIVPGVADMMSMDEEELEELVENLENAADEYWDNSAIKYALTVAMALLYDDYSALE